MLHLLQLLPASQCFRSRGSSHPLVFVQETNKKAAKAVAKPKADKPKPEKKRAAPAAKKETKKAKKDPNAPKRGLSAFMYFSNAKRDEVHICPLLLEHGLQLLDTCCCCLASAASLRRSPTSAAIVLAACFTLCCRSATLRAWPMLSKPAGCVHPRLALVLLNA